MDTVLIPPFTLETATVKVRKAEDGWNSRNPEQVALAYTVDSRWRNRAEFLNGREAIVAFLKRKWTRELDYRLIKEFGRLAEIGLPYVSLTSGMTTRANGIALMAMKTGSTTSKASCGTVTLPSMIYRSRKRTAVPLASWSTS